MKTACHLSGKFWKAYYLNPVSDHLINNNGMEEIKIHTDIIFTYTQYDELFKISFDNHTIFSLVILNYII